MPSVNGLSKSSVNGSAAVKEIISYEVDHLATLADVSTRAMDMNSIIQYLTTLRQQIWTLRCLMIFEDFQIVIIYEKTQEILAKFEYEEVRNLQYIVEPRGANTFDNLLSFTTFNAEDQHQEIHIFRTVNSQSKSLAQYIEKCQHNTKQVIHKQQKPLSNGINGGTRSLPVQPMNPSLQLARPTLIRETDSRPVTASQYAVNYYQDSQMYGRAISLGPTSPETLQPRDSEVFKHCHTDIDAFLIQIKDGQTPMAASLEEYVACLKKFKVAFILLGRLNGQIKNPNAADWVHRLMKLLWKVSSAADNMMTGRNPNSPSSLAPCVVSPLLSSEAVQLLEHCLTSEETQIWRRMGKAWCETVDVYRGEIPPLNLRFLNGNPVPADLFPAIMITGSKSTAMTSHAEDNPYNEHIYAYPTSKENRKYSPRPTHANNSHTSPMDTICTTSDEYISNFRHNKISPTEIKGQPNIYKKSQQNSIANYRPKSLSRENLTMDQTTANVVYREQDRSHHIYNHIHNRNSGNSANNHTNYLQSGASTPSLVDEFSSISSRFEAAKPPVDIHYTDGVNNAGSISLSSYLEPDYPLEPLEDSEPSEQLIPGPTKEDIRDFNFLMEVKERGGIIYHCLQSYQARNPNELTVVKGQCLELLDNRKNWWKMRDASKNTGYVASTIMKIVQDYSGYKPTSPPHVTASAIASPHSVNFDNLPNGSSYQPPAFIPPPPPIAEPASVPVIRRRSKKSELKPEPPTPQDLMLQELRGKLGTPLRKSTSIDIDINSTAGNFRTWLQAKKFSQNTQDRLEGKKVREVVAYTDEELIDLIGEEEFKRLNHHLGNLRKMPKKIDF